MSRRIERIAEVPEYQHQALIERITGLVSSGHLTGRHLTIITQRLAGVRLVEIADQYQITRERVRQIEHRALVAANMEVAS